MFIVHKKIVSAVRRVEFVSDRMLCVILRGRWCNIIVLSVHAMSEDKGDDGKEKFCRKLGRVFDHFPRKNMKNVLGHFNAKVDREDIFEPKIGNDSLHEISNDSGVREVNFVNSKHLVVKSTVFPRRRIH
jgi:hypothetical protein